FYRIQFLIVIATCRRLEFAAFDIKRDEIFLLRVAAIDDLVPLFGMAHIIKNDAELVGPKERGMVRDVVCHIEHIVSCNHTLLFGSPRVFNERTRPANCISGYISGSVNIATASWQLTVEMLRTIPVTEL